MVKRPGYLKGCCDHMVPKQRATGLSQAPGPAIPALYLNPHVRKSAKLTPIGKSTPGRGLPFALSIANQRYIEQKF